MNSCLRRTNLRTSKNISTKKRAPSLITEIMMREKTAECNLRSPQTAAELQMLHALSIKPKASEKLFIQSSLDPSTVSSFPPLKVCTLTAGSSAPDKQLHKKPGRSRGSILPSPRTRRNAGDAKQACHPQKDLTFSKRGRSDSYIPDGIWFH